MANNQDSRTSGLTNADEETRQRTPQDDNRSSHRGGGNAQNAASNS